MPVLVLAMIGSGYFKGMYDAFAVPEFGVIGRAEQMCVVTLALRFYF